MHFDYKVRVAIFYKNMIAVVEEQDKVRRWIFGIYSQPFLRPAKHVIKNILNACDIDQISVCLCLAYHAVLHTSTTVVTKLENLAVELQLVVLIESEQDAVVSVWHASVPRAIDLHC